MGQTMRQVATVVAVALAVSGCGSRLTRAQLEATNGRLAPAAMVGTSTAAPAGRLATGTSPGGDVDTATVAAAGAIPSVSPQSAGTPGAGAVRTATGAATSTPSAVSRGAGPAAAGAPEAGAPPSGGATVPAPPITPGGPGEIRLGSVGVASGPIGAAVAPIAEGARVWVADVNARGGIGGRQVRLFQADDGGDPARSVAIVKRLVEQEKVQAFYSNFMVTTEEAVVQYLDEHQVPAIGGCSCSSAVDASPMLFPIGPGAPLGETWAHVLPFLTQTDHRKVSVLYCREAANCSVMYGVMEDIADQAGFTIVHQAQVSIAQPDFTAELLAARNAGADVVVGLVDNATLVRMAKSAHRQEYKPIFSIQQSGFDDALLSQASEAEGFVTAGIVPDHNVSPQLADYRAALARYVPGGRRATISAGAWVGGKLIERLGSSLPDEPTPADFLAALHALKGETLGGLLPPTTYEAGQGHARTNLCIIPVTVRHGKFVADKGDEFICAPGWKPVGT